MDMHGSDCLDRKCHMAFMFGHYLLGMQVGKPVVKSPSVAVTVAGRGRPCWVSCRRISEALDLPGQSIPFLSLRYFSPTTRMGQVVLLLNCSAWRWNDERHGTRARNCGICFVK